MTRHIRATLGSPILIVICLFLSGCPNGGGSGSVPLAQTGASISGTVSGTRIVAVNASDQIVAQDDTAGRTPNVQGQFAWSLGNLPIGTNLRLFFITGGNVYPMYFGTPSSNVFAVNAAGSINLGHVTTVGNQATPQIPPTGVTPGPPDTTLPPSVAPILAIASPANNASLPNGPVTITFATQNFTIGLVTNRTFISISTATPFHTIFSVGRRVRSRIRVPLQRMPNGRAIPRSGSRPWRSGCTKSDSC